MRGSIWIFVLGLAHASTRTFDNDVRPVLSTTCIGCHNDKLSSGNLNIKSFLDASSLSNRDAWEAILAKLRSGEMPPKGIPRPPAEKIGALIAFVEGEFDRIDAGTPRDPGHVTARRLNR